MSDPHNRIHDSMTQKASTKNKFISFLNAAQRLATGLQPFHVPALPEAQLSLFTQRGPAPFQKGNGMGGMATAQTLSVRNRTGENGAMQRSRASTTAA